MTLSPEQHLIRVFLLREITAPDISTVRGNIAVSKGRKKGGKIKFILFLPPKKEMKAKLNLSLFCCGNPRDGWKSPGPTYCRKLPARCWIACSIIPVPAIIIFCGMSKFCTFESRFWKHFVHRVYSFKQSKSYGINQTNSSSSLARSRSLCMRYVLLYCWWCSGDRHPPHWPPSASLPFPSHEKRFQLSDWILFLPDLVHSVRAPSIFWLTRRLFIRPTLEKLSNDFYEPDYGAIGDPEDAQEQDFVLNWTIRFFFS